MPNFSSYLRLFDKIKRHRVDAIAQAGGGRAVVEYVALVATAAGALDFGARHTIGAVAVEFDVFFVNRFEKGGPSCAGFKFGVGAEEGKSTGCADEGAFFVVVPQVACESAFGALFAQNMVFRRG